jgi:hypothetical protein
VERDARAEAAVRDSDNAPGQAVAAELPSGSPIEAIEAALGVIPARAQLPLPRWLGPLAICCVIGFIPWIVYLALTLPEHSRAVDYDIAWVGYDCAMCLVLGALAYCAIRRKNATGAVAAVASTMLVVDAWFDIVTTEEGRAFWMAVAAAVIGEIPLAIICAWAAINAEFVRARAYQRLRQRWERAIQIAHSANGLPATDLDPNDQSAQR